MSDYPSVPDFTDDPASMAEALRAMKEIVERMSGQRQGNSLGAPMIYAQGFAPRQPDRLRRGDLWIDDEASAMYWWDGSVWVPL